MIRNHLIDPEGIHHPKTNPTIFNPSAYSGHSTATKSNEDPWFSGNSGDSPGGYAYGQNYGNSDPGQYSNSFSGPPTATDPIDDDYENEPPLLEELGIRFDHIFSKTQAVINIRQVLDDPICYLRFYPPQS
jgi:hypothetical protein